MDFHDAMSWSFHHFYHADKANAAIHTSETRFSPITFRLAELLYQAGIAHQSEPCMHVMDVMNDSGQYPEDAGRIAGDTPEAEKIKLF